jgi:hypothetical protein
VEQELLILPEHPSFWAINFVVSHGLWQQKGLPDGVK